MVNIQVFRSSNRLITSFSVKGHANTAAYGQDIVCAGIAALTQTAVMGLERHLQRKMNLEIESGTLVMSLLEPADALTDAVLETMLIGLTEIAKQNPKSVRISEHRR
jgi:uncharacterized protein YsxB (DUF464 family)